MLLGFSEPLSCVLEDIIIELKELIKGYSSKSSSKMLEFHTHWDKQWENGKYSSGTVLMKAGLTAKRTATILLIDYMHILSVMRSYWTLGFWGNCLFIYEVFQ